MPKAIINATTVEMPMVAQATAPLKSSLFIRLPKNQLIIAPASGAKIIRLRKLFSVISILILQNTRVVYVNRNAVAEKRDDDAEPDRRFCRRDRHYHKDEKLSGDIGVIARKGDEC